MDVTNTETETSTTTPEPAPGAFDRDALIAAVREAGGTESAAAEVAPAADAAPTEPTQAPPAPAAEPPVEEDRLAAIMRRREAAHAETQRQREEAQRIIQEAEQTRQRLIDEAKAEAKRIAEEAARERTRRYDESPLDAIRADGIDPQKLADDLLRQNDPTYREIRALKEQVAKTAEEAKAASKVREELERMRREQAEAEQRAAMQAVEQRFIAEVATPEKTPHLYARWEPEEIIAHTRNLAQRWVNDGLKYGVEFDDRDVVAYLEQQSKERLSKLAAPATPAQQVSAGAAATPPGTAPKVQANGPRTLSAAQGSERRTSPRPLHELSPEEQRKALMEEVAAARKAYPDSVF